METGESFKSIRVTNTSEILITGGMIVNTNSRSPVRLQDSSKAFISGGHMTAQTRPDFLGDTPVLQAEDESELIVTGGLFEGFGRFDTAVTIGDHAAVTIKGGSFVSHNEDAVKFRTTANGTLTITGGEFVSLLSHRVDLNVSNSSVIIRAREVSLDGNSIPFGQVTATRGILSLMYQDGTFEDISFRKSASGNLNLIRVPEPITLFQALLVAIFGTLFKYRAAMVKVEPNSVQMSLLASWKPAVSQLQQPRPGSRGRG